jgi:FAD binding domain
MNTGIQDAYNLAWKLALVVRGTAPKTLLDTYEAERRPVGVEVVARTRAATENYGRDSGGKPDRLTDTQIRISYRGTDWVRDDAEDLETTVPEAGDRAPDACGLTRHGFGFPLRLFDVLRGTEHVLVAHLAGLDARQSVTDLAAWAQQTRSQLGSHLRIVAVTAEDGISDQLGIAVLHDRQRAFADAYGLPSASFLVRPDGYIGWRGLSWRGARLLSHLGRIFRSLGPL